MPRFLLCLLLGAFAGCTLATTDVEPALPDVPVFQGNTVEYHLNGVPVVAHDYGQSLLAAIFSFGRWAKPVNGLLYPDSTLQINSADTQNYESRNSVLHGLTFQLAHFRGAGRYLPTPTATTLQLATRDAANQHWLPGPAQMLPTQNPGIIEITAWDPNTRHISGTFALRFAAAGNAAAAELQDGRFDLTLEF
ncbi:hypothetical protein MON38_07555 [Hymenobacter sp. DH14]|uniref:Uncharacterized protein n=1 Tax=Hymenobacter cyanobacteriorum TaxID=2926463 RepID=A0A9X1VEL5_9BACT|nr:hypothetical protein [Hymenobacter cyanobacteriorum]MCI1187272.1 hypothetical protein [Hymenobacter cyanobacteriorum]